MTHRYIIHIYYLFSLNMVKKYIFVMVLADVLNNGVIQRDKIQSVKSFDFFEELWTLHSPIFRFSLRDKYVNEPILNEILHIQGNI